MPPDPTVLVILNGPTQDIYFTELAESWNLHFFLFDPELSPEEHVRVLLQKIATAGWHLDGVVGVTDEPSIVAALLAERLGLTTTPPVSIYRAQNKAVFKQFATQVAPAHPPTFVLTRPAEGAEIVGEELFPAFIKPARGSLSVDSYLVHSPDHLHSVLKSVFRKRRQLVDWAELFFQHWAQPDDPPSRSFLLQPFIDARQFTVDGWVCQGQMGLFGVTETVYTPDRKSFERFDCPAHLRAPVYRELEAMLTQLVALLEYDNAVFNMEFFVTDNEDIIPIEFNTRLSIQFSPLWRQRFTKSNIDVMLEIAIGRTPDPQPLPQPRRASSCVLRTYQDQLVTAVPTPTEIATLKAAGYLESVRLLADVGTKLSDYKQDAYTYRYALIDIAGNTHKDILRKLEYVKQHLHFGLVPV